MGDGEESMKNGSIGGGTARVVAVCIALLLLPKIALAGDGVDAAADAAVSCTTSATCAFPTPYCSPALHACVQCTSDRNCDGGLVCDVLHGVCRTCNGDADCPSSKPYCDLVGGACIECVTDANCSTGEKCAAGKCGSCGDGICGRSELIEGVFFGGPGTSYNICEEDCAKLCPQHDLKSALGRGLVSGNFKDERAVFPPSCSPLDSAPNVVIGWQAPHAGNFFAAVSGTPTSIASWNGSCIPETPGGGSYSCGGGDTDFMVSAKEGDTVTFVLTPTVEPWGAYSFDLTDHDPLCDGGNCPSIGTGGSMTTKPVSDAAAASAAAMLCLDNARMRHDDMCSGVECACAHCPQDYDDCHVVPGCGDISDCLTEKHCVGADCYISGQCRSVVDTYGGLSGPAFRAASGLQSCSLSLGCGLPCADGGSTSKPATDAGVLDAGPVCAAGRVVECPCEGGVTGTKQCLADGSGFKACVCGEPPLTPVSTGGCKCRMGVPAPHDGGAAGALAVLALGLLRRRSRRSAEGT
jgi:hypothetical protein